MMNAAKEIFEAGPPCSVDKPQSHPYAAASGNEGNMGKVLIVVLLLLAFGAADGYLIYRDSQARSTLEEMQTKVPAAEEALLQAQQEQLSAKRQSVELSDDLNAARNSLTEHSKQLAAAQQQGALLDESLGQKKKETAKITRSIKKLGETYERLLAEPEQNPTAGNDCILQRMRHLIFSCVARTCCSFGRDGGNCGMFSGTSLREEEKPIPVTVVAWEKTFK